WRSCCANVRELGLQHRVRRFGLDEIVDARAAATLIRVVEGNKLQAGNCRQYRERRFSHALRMLQVAGRIISDSYRECASCPRTCPREQLADIAHARADSHCALVPLAVVLEQMSVLLHDRTAA